MGSSGRTIAVFLQARMGSSRLPGKALLPLSGRPSVEHAMAALRQVPADLRVLLTDAGSADALRPIARRSGFELFVGPEDDVLARYAMAAAAYGAETIIRATGDNPLVSASLARSIVRHMLRRRADYGGYRDIPVGAGVEAVRAAAILEAAEEAADPYEREHVTPFLYRRPERFRIERPLPPREFRNPDLRITLDTDNDYRFLLRLFDELYSNEPIPLDRVLGWSRRKGAGKEEGGAGPRAAADSLR